MIFSTTGGRKTVIYNLRHLLIITWSNVGGVHSGSTDAFVKFVKFLSFLKEPEEGRHRAEIKGAASNEDRVVQNARDFGEHGANVLGTQRHVDVAQLLHRQRVALLIHHHRAVVKPIEIRQRLTKFRY